MNRRELLQNGLAVLSAVGIDGEVATLTARNPQAIVLTVPRTLSNQASQKLKEIWKRTFKGTSLESVPVLVLEEGLQLQVIDQVDQ